MPDWLIDFGPEGERMTRWYRVPKVETTFPFEDVAEGGSPEAVEGQSFNHRSRD